MENRPQPGVSLVRVFKLFFFFNLIKRINFAVADLKKGKVYKGAATSDGVKIDTTITIDDNDMVDMVRRIILMYDREIINGINMLFIIFTFHLQAIGKLNPQVAFVKGKLKIKGNVLLAQKLKSLTVESKL